MSSLNPPAVAPRLGYVVKRLQHELRLRMDAALRPLGLTTPQYAVLSALLAEPGQSNAALARLAFVTPQTMQAILVNLEKAGLVARAAAADHGRILRTVLTDQGKARVAAANDTVTGIEAALFAALAPDEAASMAARLALCLGPEG